MQVLRESTFVSMPWKNGGGVTREICRSPAGGADFDWRLSLATVGRTGPFSRFEGYGRTLVLIQGAGMELDFGVHGSARLTSPGEMAWFDGSWTTHGRLIDGTSTDLNLMVAQDRMEADVAIHALHTPLAVVTAGFLYVLVCCVQGDIELENTLGEPVRLAAVDVARCVSDEGPLICRPCGPTIAQVFIARIRRRATIA